MFDLSNRWIDYYLIDNIQRVSRRKNLPINQWLYIHVAYNVTNSTANIY